MDKITEKEAILVGQTRERWHKAEQASQRARTNYWMNYAYYEGHQWLNYDRYRSTVENYTTNRGDGKARLSINRIRPNLETLVGKFTQTDLAFEVAASASDDAALTGARLGEYVLEAGRTDDGWEYRRNELVLDSMLGGVSALVSHPAADGPFSVAAGKEKGKIIVPQALSIAEFAVMPGARDARTALWFFQQTAVHPEMVREHYNLTYTPGTDTSAGLDPLIRSDTGRTFEDVVENTTVYVMYERPNQARPEGAVVHMAGGRILSKSKWPFPFDDHLNLVVFSASSNRKNWLAGTFVTQARPIQAAYNYVRSNILEHVKRAGQAKLMNPNGAIEDTGQITDMAGEHIDYDADLGKPDYLNPPALQRWLTQEPAQLSNEIDDIMYVHDISRGEAPGDRNSGLALSILAEKDDTPLGFITRNQALGWELFASDYLQVAEKTSGQKIATYKTPEGVPIEVKWSGRMLKGQTRVHVPLEATSPYSRAARMAQIISMKQTFPEMFESLDPAAFVRIAQFPGLKNIGEMLSADAVKAIRENHLMSIGETCIPEKFDDHAIHLAELDRFRKTQEFERLPLKSQNVYELHAQAHERLLGEEAAEQRLKNEIVPGSAALPQAGSPIGSLMPSPVAEQNSPAGVLPQI